METDATCTKNDADQFYVISLGSISVALSLYPKYFQTFMLEKIHTSMCNVFPDNTWNGEGVLGRSGHIYRDFRRIEIYVVDSAAGKVSPARGQPLFDGLERYI